MALINAAGSFDLQGHRGARDERPENTLAGFAHALEVGVSTLEMDLQVTRDGHVIVSHNAFLEPFLAQDAQGHWVSDHDRPQINLLTLAELKRYDVGQVNPLSAYWLQHGKTQQAVPGERVPTLSEVFELVRRYGDSHVRFNLETKVQPDHPDWTPDPYSFARQVLGIVDRHGMAKRTMIQSFDWRVLWEVRRLKPEILRVALTAEQLLWGPTGLFREVGRPGCSPWMGGLDIDDFNGDYVLAAKALHANVISPFYQEVTQIEVSQAHAVGMKIVPWTVNDQADIARLIDLGVDGLITDRPTLLREILKVKGIPLPKPMPRLVGALSL